MLTYKISLFYFNTGNLYKVIYHITVTYICIGLCIFLSTLINVIFCIFHFIKPSEVYVPEIKFFYK